MGGGGGGGGAIAVAMKQLIDKNFYNGLSIFYSKK
jgi:hypothetical protein